MHAGEQLACFADCLGGWVVLGAYEHCHGLGIRDSSPVDLIRLD
jgi:hypothetical protein